MLIFPSMERRAPLPPHEILIEARGQIEASHRLSLYHYSHRRVLMPCPFPPDTCSQPIHDDIQDLCARHAEDCCNKSVPIYIISGHSRQDHVLSCALHNWLYHKWYRLYRSDIEYGQFVAKLFIPCRLPVDMPPTSLVHRINQLNASICDRVISVQKEVQALPAESKFVGAPVFRDQRFYFLQPLFKALTIILLADDFTIRTADVGKMPALVTLTGEEHGLSQPLTFESISDQVEEFVSHKTVRVPLKTAIEFVLAQQGRENDVFGPQPDPVESTRDLQAGCGFISKGIHDVMRRLGWTDKPVDGPSSTWVDPEVHTEWAGSGAVDDKNMYKREEKHLRWRMLLQVAEVQATRGIIKRRRSF